MTTLDLKTPTIKHVLRFQVALANELVIVLIHLFYNLYCKLEIDTSYKNSAKFLSK